MAALAALVACVYTIRARASGRTWVGSTVDTLHRSREHASNPPPRLKADAEAARVPGETRAVAVRRLFEFPVFSWHPSELSAELSESILIHIRNTTDPQAGYDKLKGKPTWDKGTRARIFCKKRKRPPPRE